MRFKKRREESRARRVELSCVRSTTAARWFDPSPPRGFGGGCRRGRRHGTDRRRPAAPPPRSRRSRSAGSFSMTFSGSSSRSASSARTSWSRSRPRSVEPRAFRLTSTTPSVARRCGLSRRCFVSSAPRASSAVRSRRRISPQPTTARLLSTPALPPLSHVLLGCAALPSLSHRLPHSALPVPSRQSLERRRPSSPKRDRAVRRRRPTTAPRPERTRPPSDDDAQQPAPLPETRPGRPTSTPNNERRPLFPETNATRRPPRTPRARSPSGSRFRSCATRSR